MKIAYVYSANSQLFTCALYLKVPMKKIASTAVLFILLTLTVFALNHFNFPKASALGTATDQTHHFHK
jgi:hypothetical protein